jgi:hypothetical protein
MTEGKSAVQQIEEGSDQVKLRVSQAIARTGAPEAPAITEYLSGFKAAKELAQNQEEFSLRIKRVRENVDLSDDERLEAGRIAAQEAQERHQELSQERRAQADARQEKLNRTLFFGSNSLTLNALTDLGPDQLDVRADLAYNAGNAEMLKLKAIRAVAATKGFSDLVEKTVGMDPDHGPAAAYTERQQLRSVGALDALMGAYSPPPVTSQQLRPSSADVERARQARARQEASSKRILSGNPGITDRT